MSVPAGAVCGAAEAVSRTEPGFDAAATVPFAVGVGTLWAANGTASPGCVAGGAEALGTVGIVGERGWVK